MKRGPIMAIGLALLTAFPILAQDATAPLTPVEIPAGAAAPASQVRGLRMEFYPFNPDLPKGLDSLNEAMVYIVTSQPQTAMQLDAPAINFPVGQRFASDIGITLGDYFFGAEGFAAKKAAGSPMPERMSTPIGRRSVFVLRGFFEVKKAGVYKLRVPVDDGAEVKIGGKVVFFKNDFGGMGGEEEAKYNAAMSFTAPGIYSIRIIHWDRGDNLGIHILSDMYSTEPGAFALLPLITRKNGADL